MNALTRCSRATQILAQASLLLSLVVITVPAAAADSAGQVYRLAGDVQAGAASAQLRRLVARDDIFVADTVVTADDSNVVLALNDGSSLVLEEGSQMLVSDYVLDPEPNSLLSLTKGRLRATVGRAFAGRRNSFQVHTDELVIGVQGTDFSVLALGGVSRVYVYDGLVELVSTDPAFPEPVLLRPGEFSEARRGEPIDPPRPFSGPTTAYQDPGSGSSVNPRYFYPPPLVGTGIDPCNELGFRSNDYMPDPRRTYIEGKIRDGEIDPYAGAAGYGSAGYGGAGYRPGVGAGSRPGYRPGYGPGYGPAYGPAYGPGYGPAYGPVYAGGPCPRYGTRDPIPEYYDDDWDGSGNRPPPDYHDDAKQGYPPQGQGGQDGQNYDQPPPYQRQRDADGYQFERKRDDGQPPR